MQLLERREKVRNRDQFSTTPKHEWSVFRNSEWKWTSHAYLLRLKRKAAHFNKGPSLGLWAVERRRLYPVEPSKNGALGPFW